MYILINGSPLKLVRDCFKLNNTNQVHRPVHRVLRGIESLSYLILKNWEDVPNDMKNLSALIQPSGVPLNSDATSLVHVDFVEPLSNRLFCLTFQCKNNLFFKVSLYFDLEIHNF